MLAHMDITADPDDSLIASAIVPQKFVLCLSGGGYRAMLYHVGALWRLNEWGFLPKLGLISSVSGGSITAGVLGLNWGKLVFDTNDFATNFEEKIAIPILATADRTLDIPCTLLGIFDAGGAGHQVAMYHEKHLFGPATLQDLPDEATSPRFIFNAANLQTAVNWRFCRAFMGDYRVGLIHNPTVKLSVAVAASGAFPPFLSPLRLNLSSKQYTEDDKSDLKTAEYRENVLLTDGGVYDNLGFQVATKYETVFVSDGGLPTKAETSISRPQQLLRVLNLLDNQVRNRRRVELISSYEKEERKGAYWRMNDNLEAEGLKINAALACPYEKTTVLAQVPTRLKKLDKSLQKKLINFGYASCDIWMRRKYDSQLRPPIGFPYTDIGL